MPPAVGIALGGLGALGSAAGGASGKKSANRAAQQQLQLQQQQFGLQKGQVGLGNTAWHPAFDYFNNLLKGGQAAVQATGPYASLIGQANQGARNSIQALTPRGGEQNLAVANSFNQQANDISRLYAGMQPAAAQGLGQLAGEAYGSGQQFAPFANTGAALQNYQFNQGQKGNAAGGFGNLLYNAINQKRSGAGAGPTTGGV